MHEQIHYDQWLAHRRAAGAPVGVSREVMRAVHALKRPALAPWWEPIAARPLVQAGLALAALAGLALRFALLFTVAVG